MNAVAIFKLASFDFDYLSHGFVILSKKDWLTLRWETAKPGEMFSPEIWSVVDFLNPRTISSENPPDSPTGAVGRGTETLLKSRPLFLGSKGEFTISLSVSLDSPEKVGDFLTEFTDLLSVRAF
jgi:hypothetical protein